MPSEWDEYYHNYGCQLIWPTFRIFQWNVFDTALAQVNHKNTKKKEKNGNFFFHKRKGGTYPRVPVHVTTEWPNPVSARHQFVFIICSFYVGMGALLMGIVTVCVFVCHLFSFYPFYFDFHSARIIFDVSPGFYLWNINKTTAWHL